MIPRWHPWRTASYPWIRAGWWILKCLHWILWNQTRPSTGDTPMLIDTHCHLDASEFSADRAAVIERSGENGVSGIVIPSVARFNFETVRELAHSFKGGHYALGIHP